MRMPNVTRLLAPLALTALCTLPAAAQFEGTITYVVGARQTPMTQTIKGNMVRTEMQGDRGGRGAMIMDASAQTMTMVMDEQKMYMTMDLKNRPNDEDRAERKMPKITDMGKTETIAGKSCNVYRMATEEGKPDNIEVCAAKGMGFFMGGGRGPMGRGRGQGEGPDATALMANPEFAKMYKDGFFPLRLSRIRDGNVTNQMLATKIEPKSVDASLFQVPAGYQEMKMPAGMGPGMGPGGPPQRP